MQALSSAVIYGPNSSGKTNIIGGMEVFRSIILYGNIKNKDTDISPNAAIRNLELIPNIESEADETVYFYIKFLVEDMIIELSLELKIGGFFQPQYDRKIIGEELKVNQKLIYKRSDKIEIGKVESILGNNLVEGFQREIVEKIASGNLDDKELFFNGLFKNLYSKKIYDIIIKWFQEKFQIIYHSDKLEIELVYDMKQGNRKSLYVDKTLNEALKCFGITSYKIAFPITENSDAKGPVSMVKINEKGEGLAITADAFESFGTIRFLNIFPAILSALKYGKTLVIDELDASIHPMAIMNIVNIFHNDELSINKCKNYKKFKYYTDNPDMTINECVGQILKECGAMKK